MGASPSIIALIGVSIPVLLAVASVPAKFPPPSELVVQYSEIALVFRFSVLYLLQSGVVAKTYNISAFPALGMGNDPVSISRS